jgi:hypothetical protein
MTNECGGAFMASPFSFMACYLEKLSERAHTLGSVRADDTMRPIPNMLRTHFQVN